MLSVGWIWILPVIYNTITQALTSEDSNNVTYLLQFKGIIEIQHKGKMLNLAASILIFIFWGQQE